MIVLLFPAAIALMTFGLYWCTRSARPEVIAAKRAAEYRSGARSAVVDSTADLLAELRAYTDLPLPARIVNITSEA